MVARAVAVDIGGTKVALAMICSDGRISVAVAGTADLAAGVRYVT